ncbi:hypothetical protein OC834_003530 [Tilletia horrida]|uniref:Mitochondrial zinc maintenance protein 1, mitochondrial n=1 Tax=Tilletia horrida TaxID=155126 RepID=A0AAN6GEA7_9BASI|nr:hypothetical protein OC834_003530 [Tilletia horrida]KAK0534450.1 hypothetical protein OC842_002639 [Tilletia horrida]KAK0559763.1 hypothetical protein OC844_004190 [Tilletia horrida]
MSASSSALSPAQRTHLVHLYRRILRASQTAFANDQATLSAWRVFAASRFRGADADPAKYGEHVKHAEEVEQTLRQNVVQGTFRQETGAISLRIRPETELGSNETIKQNRNKQIADLKSSKRPTLTCGGAAPSTASSSRHAHAFSTLAALRAAASAGTSSPVASSRSGSIGSPAHAGRPIPRPIPSFPQLTILADGSSILLNSTSPRHTTRLTRDPTNHPLWNPALADRKMSGAGGEDGEGAEDAGGRLGRFRRRFDVGLEAAAPAPAPTTASKPASSSKAAASASAAATATAGKKGAATASSSAAKASGPGASKPAAPTPAPASASSSRRAASFSMDDLDWMSVGGRQARAGSEPAGKKGKKK